MWYEYRKAIEELDQAQKDLKEILDLQEEAFQMTQPKSVQTDRDGGSAVYVDKTAEYLERVEKMALRERLQTAREALAAKRERVEAVTILLKASGLLDDRIYYLRYIEHRPAQDIASILHYTQSYVYKTLKKFENS